MTKSQSSFLARRSSSNPKVHPFRMRKRQWASCRSPDGRTHVRDGLNDFARFGLHDQTAPIVEAQGLGSFAPDPHLGESGPGLQEEIVLDEAARRRLDANIDARVEVSKDRELMACDVRPPVGRIISEEEVVPTTLFARGFDPRLDIAVQKPHTERPPPRSDGECTRFEPDGASAQAGSGEHLGRPRCLVEHEGGRQPRREWGRSRRFGTDSGDVVAAELGGKPPILLTSHWLAEL